MTTFDTIYQDIVRKIMDEGIEELNVRTGHKTKALPGVTFQIDIEKDGFPLLTLRKQPLKSPIAEQVWFLQGDKDATFLRKFTKMWDLFLEEDGTLSSAYGWRWKHHFGRDQLGKAIELLEKDPSSRHGVVITWDPADDGYGGTPKKNVPCPYAFTINIIGGRLHMHNIIRSNDIMLGTPFDTFGFALLQCMIAEHLGVKPGIYTHSIANAHIYDNHYEGAKEIMSRVNDHQNISIQIPKDAIKRSRGKDESLIEEMFAEFSKNYQPLAPISGLDIVL
ncbi:MAG: thymidylate synthase [Candidatus Pacebacteria bacterium]|nr:thymidylate synthase [Candidatus Paceibacterota bacterium]MBP9715937.1 thymidylate synthase [Candidatus Paceibacterota bacterium]